MRQFVLLEAVLAVIFLGGCHGPIETKASHIVHPGELASLEYGTHADVPVARDKRFVNDLAAAMESGDNASIQTMIAAGQVVMVPSSTHVHVLRESFNERCVRIEEGVHAGSEGWVPYEWLKLVGKPAARGTL
jgi:hypothetical protein